ncbi:MULTISPECIES: flagellin N-terminal helical domain-containing protein [unclassified Modestobacter]|uniref:flagellin N-terminal helical domain-containing protein n=2 Tax=Modestobacter TaxID=88138 RepID=UPI0022AADF87|nr:MULTISPECIES: flagellin [unclassified Modestobacter]MCZ2810399.1 flagellin [Modestobacter sp. VKM Ac-2979]MCZ2841885.1 flagellin [Modestobacter sp. VKM Ac-2980]MCZ2847060.1 flagellin [Modestobacter sp. VKM Ac-2978]
MGLSVNNNIAAMNSYRNLSVTDSQMSKSLEKLSSGFRINRAADDAAGLAISEGLRSQIGGLKMAVRNTQDGISVVQTAEGALTETHKILQRMRDLSVQASNEGSLNGDAKKNIQSEIGQLKSELDRIASTTNFNGKQLLDGKYNTTFQVGANAGETIGVSIGTAMGAQGLGVDGVDVSAASTGGTAGSTTTAAAANQASVATLTATAALTTADFDALNGSISYGGKSLDLASVKYDAAESAAQSLARLQTAADATFGTGAVTVADGGTGVTFTGTDPGATPTAQDLADATVSFTVASGASEAIGKIDEAIKSVSTTRADLGAIQNRFEHTVNNLNVAVENLSASESRIRDTDMAQEMTNFTRTQILTQAGTAMLAQANQAPQGILKLLG